MTGAIVAQFDRCRPWIDAALARRGEATPDALLAALVAGRAQLWPGERAVFVSQCVQDARGRSIHIWLGGGKLADLMAMRPGIEAWARAMGCGEATLDGRKGWERALKTVGFERDGPLLRKRL